MNKQCEVCRHPTRKQCAICERWVCSNCHHQFSAGMVCEYSDRLCSKRCAKQYKADGRNVDRGPTASSTARHLADRSHTVVRAAHDAEPSAAADTARKAGAPTELSRSAAEGRWATQLRGDVWEQRSTSSRVVAGTERLPGLPGTDWHPVHRRLLSGRHPVSLSGSSCRTGNHPGGTMPAPRPRGRTTTGRTYGRRQLHGDSGPAADRPAVSGCSRSSSTAASDSRWTTRGHSSPGTGWRCSSPPGACRTGSTTRVPSGS